MISVLVVDDEKLVRDTLHRFIDWKNLGVDAVYEAENGMRALAIMEAHYPSIVISDIKMPHMNGMEFAELIRKRYPNSRLIFLSGYSDKVYLKNAIYLHADAYIEKPLNLNEIVKTVGDLIALYKQELAKRAPEIYFYRGDVSEASLNQNVFQISKTEINEIGQKLKSKDPSDGLRKLRKVCDEMRSCEATDPDYIRSVYSMLGLQLESAADLHGAQAAKAMSDSFIYTVSNYRLISELETELLKIAEQFVTESLAHRADPVTKVNEYLHANYTDSTLSIEKLAQNLNFNTSYLCALYKRHTGRTINAALTTLRVEQACQLLKEPTRKLYEIGACVGYPNGKYFTKVFTKELGVTPREYRERHL